MAANTTSTQKAQSNIKGGWLTLQTGLSYGKPVASVQLYNTGAQNSQDAVSRYYFDVECYKDTATYEEYLKITAYILTVPSPQNPINTSDYATCAVIERLRLVDLEKQLLDLRNYGVFFERKHFLTLRQAIENIYPFLERKPTHDSTIPADEDIKGIFEMFVRYIHEIPIEPDKTKRYYHIPVTEFKEFLEGTKYTGLSYNHIRAKLAEYEVDGKAATKHNVDRTDNTIVDESSKKRIKVISFEKKAVDKVKKDLGLPDYQVTSK